MLLGWKNDPETRNNAIVTSAEIRLDDHMRWLTSTLGNPGINLQVILMDGEPVGDVRIDYETEISIRLDPKHRGKGLATQVIAMMIGAYEAKILPHNIASLRAFIKNGYLPVRFVEGVTSYYIFKNYS